jgi:hypothetical protein
VLTSIRATSFPVLLIIALYERQSKKNETIGFYETVSAAAERILDTLPRNLKRLSELQTWMIIRDFVLMQLQLSLKVLREWTLISMLYVNVY